MIFFLIKLLLLLLVGLLLAIKFYIRYTAVIYKRKEALLEKTVIVTGANSGIGMLCAKDFAKRGAKVIMVCRDMNKAERVKSKIVEETGNKNIIVGVNLKHVDFTSLETVRKCAYEILDEVQNIHVLLNNAGCSGADFKETEDGIDSLMQANHFGPFLFTNILLGKIKESAPSRIVNVSSYAHALAKLDLNLLKSSSTTNGITHYSNSKLVVNYFSNYLAKLVENTGVTVNALHPGVFASDIIRHESFIVRVIWRAVVKAIANTLEEGASTSIYLCVSKEVNNVTGKYFANCKLETPSKISQDMGIAKKIWELSEEAVNLKQEEKHY